jgi:hypothetical protein
MSEREIIRDFSIQAEIYDVELTQKIVEKIKADMPELEENTILGLDIIFDMSVYQKVEFYQYPLSKEHKGPQPRREEEKAKEFIYDVLSEQLQKTIKALEEIGLSFGFTAIIGDEEIGKNVQVTLYKQEPIQVPKGKRKANFKVNTITPDRPFIQKQLAKALAEHFWKEFKEGRLQELEKKLHKENWVTADRLFSAIAKALQNGAEDIEKTKAKLIAEAIVESDFPLFITSRTRNDTSDVMTPETKIDCPEYLIFRQTSGGSWNIKKIEDLQSANQLITKDGLNKKRYKTIIVLHNEQVVPYALFAETEDGIVPVTPEEAHAYKKLLLSWDKGTQG